MLFLFDFLLFELYSFLIVVKNDRDQNFIGSDIVQNFSEIITKISPLFLGQTGSYLVFVAEDNDLSSVLGVV